MAGPKKDTNPSCKASKNQIVGSNLFSSFVQRSKPPYGSALFCVPQTDKEHTTLVNNETNAVLTMHSVADPVLLDLLSRMRDVRPSGTGGQPGGEQMPGDATWGDGTQRPRDMRAFSQLMEEHGLMITDAET